MTVDPHDDTKPLQDTLDGLAEIFCAGEIDPDTTDRLVELIEFFLQPFEVRYFRAAMERCPVHGCDVEICIDDHNPECVVERALFENRPVTPSNQ